MKEVIRKIEARIAERRQTLERLEKASSSMPFPGDAIGFSEKHRAIKDLEWALSLIKEQEGDGR